MMRHLIYDCSLQEYINGLIAEKRAVGYKYSASAWTLYKFDQFCVDRQYSESLITRDLVYAWIERRPNEALATQQNRAGVIRQLALYMTRLGLQSYVLPPKTLPRKQHYQPYIFSDAEIAAILNKVDACRSCSQVPLRHLIMPLLFRLLYGCGLRLSEALHLRLHEVDLDNGVLTIMDGKFNKDRLVPMSTQCVVRCRDYVQTVHTLSDDQSYFFPSPDGSPIKTGNIYKNYRRFLWQAGISHGGWGKGPRLHDMRHTHCVHCLRKWVFEGVDLAAYLPVLKTYMGHYSFQDTAHYLRLTAELYPDIIAKTEKAFGDIIPLHEEVLL